MQFMTRVPKLLHEGLKSHQHHHMILDLTDCCTVAALANQIYTHNYYNSFAQNKFPSVSVRDNPNPSLPRDLQKDYSSVQTPGSVCTFEQ